MASGLFHKELKAISNIALSTILLATVACAPLSQDTQDNITAIGNKVETTRQEMNTGFDQMDRDLASPFTRWGFSLWNSTPSDL